MKKIFQTKNSWAEIFIQLWAGCPTNCQSCKITKMEIRYYSLKEVKKQIDLGNEIADEKFSFFLYWTDNKKNPHLNEIANYIKSIGREYKIQIAIDTKREDIEKIIKDNMKNSLNKFIISKKIKNKQDINKLIESFKNLRWIRNTFFNYDLLIDLKYKNVFEKIFKKKFKKESEWIYFLDWANIKLYIRSLYFINYKEKKIENLNLKNCLIYDSFNINDEIIEVIDHFEIDEKLDITFHNPLCYIWQPKISNIWKPKSMILQDFLKYKNNYLKKFSKNMNKSCFECITNNYHY